MIADAFGGSGRRQAPGPRRPRAAATSARTAGRSPIPVLRDQIAQNEMDTRAFLLTVQRSRDAAKAGHQPGPESSIFKVYGDRAEPAPLRAAGAPRRARRASAGRAPASRRTSSSARATGCARAATPSRAAPPRCSATSSRSACSACRTRETTMQLVLSEDQELIAQDRRRLRGAEVADRAHARAARRGAIPIGFSRALWKEMAELGWVGIPFPEAVGGAGLGLADLAVVLEALGRSLAPEPFLSTVLLGGRALALGGSDAQREAWLPRRRGGRRASSPSPSRRPRAATTCAASRRAPSAPAAAGGSRARRSRCSTATSPTRFVVAARTARRRGRRRAASRSSWCRRARRGLEVVRQTRIDHRNAALVRLDGVEVGAGDVVGEVGRRRRAARAGGRPRHGRALRRDARRHGAGLRADARVPEDARRSSACRSARFQALKHRAANCFIEIELARSACWRRRAPSTPATPTRARLVSLAKARCSDAFVLVANEGVQMFGGVGMTDEYDIGFYLKRARVAELTFGDAAFHRDRWARARGLLSARRWRRRRSRPPSACCAPAAASPSTGRRSG